MKPSEFFETVKRGTYTDSIGNTTIMLAWNDDDFYDREAKQTIAPSLGELKNWLYKTYNGHVEERYASVGSLSLGSEICLLVTLGTQGATSYKP